MPSTAIWFGRLLIVLGLLGYGYGMYTGAASPTALIPAGFGIALMILGHVSVARESLRKHLMHVAVLIGLAGFLIPTWRIISKISDFSLTFASAMLISMAIICLAFVVLCVKSFVDARRSGAV